MSRETNRRGGPRRGASHRARSLLAGISPIGIAIALILLLIGCWYLAFRTMGDGAPRFGAINAGGHIWGMIALACTAVAAIRRAWITAVFGAVLTALILAQVHWPLPWSADSAQRFRVVTASLRSGNKDMADAGKTLAALSPDILLVQEANDPEAFLAAFRQGRPGWHVATAGTSLIVSRWPIISPWHDKDLFRAKVMLPGRPITVWNVHAPKDYVDIAVNRRFNLKLVQDIVQQGSGIAAGDYNASPWNEAYIAVDGVMDDGYRRTRWMPGFTFPGGSRRSGTFGAFIAIDHVFATADLKPLTGFVAQSSLGADHLPVVVEYALPEAPLAR